MYKNMNNPIGPYQRSELERIRRRRRAERNETLFAVACFLTFGVIVIIAIALYYGIIAALIVWIATEIMQAAHTIWH
jgi:hypothetical protein